MTTNETQTPEDAAGDVLQPLDFVYCGVRMADKGELLHAVAPIRNGTVSKAGFYKLKGKIRWLVGGVYRGASFSDTKISGWPSARYVERWNVKTDLIQWEAENDEAEAQARTQKLEADAKRQGEIMTVLLPLRAQYEACRKRGDLHGMDALSNAVLRALRRAPTDKERIRF